MVLKSIIDALLINKSHLSGSICVITFISSINIPQAFAEVLYFDDGGTYYVDYTVSDGISISNGTTLNVQDGAAISASPTLNGGATLNDSSSTTNIQGGEVNGVVEFSDLNMTGGQINGSAHNYNLPGGDFYMSDGIIDGRLDMLGGNATISGGAITNGIFSEALAYLDISGGTFGSINTISGSYDISGGSFLGELNVGYDRSAHMDITGGIFSGGFSYGPGAESGHSVTAFNFFGFNDLSLSTPELIGAGAYNSLYYKAIVSGTMLDGSYISQTILCDDHIGVNPCSGVSISSVPVPAAVWLFGSGLIGLIGLARRKTT